MPCSHVSSFILRGSLGALRHGSHVGTAKAPQLFRLAHTVVTSSGELSDTNKARRHIIVPMAVPVWIQAAAILILLFLPGYPVLLWWDYMQTGDPPSQDSWRLTDEASKPSYRALSKLFIQEQNHHGYSF